MTCTISVSGGDITGAYKQPPLSLHICASSKKSRWGIKFTLEPWFLQPLLALTSPAATPVRQRRVGAVPEGCEARLRATRRYRPGAEPQVARARGIVAWRSQAPPARSPLRTQPLWRATRVEGVPRAWLRGGSTR